MCVCVCACMHVVSVDSVALVRMLDSLLAGSVAIVTFPWRHLSHIAALKTQHQSLCL